MLSPNYHSSSNRAAKGNSIADIIEYTMLGTEADLTVQLEKMFAEVGANKYFRLTIVPEAGMTVNTIDIGYVSRDADEADDLDYFAAAKAITAELAVPIGYKKLNFDHDISIVINGVATAGNAGKVLRLVLEYVTDAG